MTVSERTSGRIDLVGLANEADALLNRISGAVSKSRTRAIKESLGNVEDLLSDVASALYDLRENEETEANETIEPADLAGQDGRA